MRRAENIDADSAEKPRTPTRFSRWSCAKPGPSTLQSWRTARSAGGRTLAAQVRTSSARHVERRENNCRSSRLAFEEAVSKTVRGLGVDNKAIRAHGRGGRESQIVGGGVTGAPRGRGFRGPNVHHSCGGGCEVECGGGCCGGCAVVGRKRSGEASTRTYGTRRCPDISRNGEDLAYFWR